MKTRIISALFLIPLVIYGIFNLSFANFAISITCICLLGFWEWTQFVGLPAADTGKRIKALLPAIIAIALFFLLLPPNATNFSHLSPAYGKSLTISILWWGLASIMALTYPRSAAWWQSCPALKQLFGLLTLLPFLFSILLIRAVNYTDAPHYGAHLVLLVCLLVWGADSGAYFVGKFCGRHKMSPAVSPNKTIEGLCGGVVTAMLIGSIYAYSVDIYFMSPAHMCLIMGLTVIISVLGDLAESMFKRVANVKDSGQIIPGHGGILDRIDSLTAAFPVFAFLYFYLQ